jgi:hypothetical protein
MIRPRQEQALTIHFSQGLQPVQGEGLFAAAVKKKGRRLSPDINNNNNNNSSSSSSIKPSIVS